MSIAEKHLPLSEAAANWLLAVANPTVLRAHPTPLPAASEIAPVLHAAELHGVLPAALRALRPPGSQDDVGPLAGDNAAIRGAKQAINAAKALQINQTGFELLLKHHGAKAIEALNAASIAAAIVKGPTFASRLYVEPAMRCFTDIDILIPSQARGAAAEVMRGLGFAFRARDYRVGQDYCEDNWLLVDDPRVGIEIHSNLVHNPKLRRTASVTLDDVASAGNGNTNDATAILFVAAAHGAISHQFDRLQHLVDVALAANGAAGGIDVERLASAARASGVFTGVHAAFVVAGVAFGDQPCLAMAKSLRPSPFDWMVSGLITPQAVLAARSSQRSGSSWRRKALRQALRLGVTPVATWQLNPIA